MSRMLEMLRDLVAHKGRANAALLTAIRQNPKAASDSELLSSDTAVLRHRRPPGLRLQQRTILRGFWKALSFRMARVPFHKRSCRYVCTRTTAEGASGVLYDAGSFWRVFTIPPMRPSPIIMRAPATTHPVAKPSRT